MSIYVTSSLYIPIFRFTCSVTLRSVYPASSQTDVWGIRLRFVTGQGKWGGVQHPKNVLFFAFVVSAFTLDLL